MMFGTKSEKIAREVEQLELKLEELKRPLISGLETTLMNLALVPPL